MEQLHRKGCGSGCGLLRESHEVLDDGVADIGRVLSEIQQQ